MYLYITVSVALPGTQSVPIEYVLAGRARTRGVCFLNFSSIQLRVLYQRNKSPLEARGGPGGLASSLFLKEPLPGFPRSTPSRTGHGLHLGTRLHHRPGDVLHPCTPLLWCRPGRQCSVSSPFSNYPAFQWSSSRFLNATREQVCARSLPCDRDLGRMRHLPTD